MEELILFFIHVICYWTMVFLYDNNMYDNSLAVSSSLKNQVLYTLPTTFIFSNIYPIHYDNFIDSFLIHLINFKLIPQCWLLRGCSAG